MFFSILSGLTVAVMANAATTFLPTAPGTGDVFKSGAGCPIKWDIDTTGAWTNVTIDLMSGSSKEMVFVARVADKLDGTFSSPVPFSWVCPEVDVNSAIYFYQFTNGDNAKEALWTSRFTISSTTGETTPPAHATQPDGQPRPWGVGHLTKKPIPTSDSAPTVPSSPSPAAHDEASTSGITQVRRDSYFKCTKRYCRASLKN